MRVAVKVLVGMGVFVLVDVKLFVGTGVLVLVEVKVLVKVGVAGMGMTWRASTIAFVSVLVVPVNWIVITPPLGEMLLNTLSSAALPPTWAYTSKFDSTLLPLMETLKTLAPTAKSPE